MSTKFDAIVIGTGQSGPSLAERLAQAGQRVAVIERKHFGGTCVNTGCIPTKALIASAHAAHLAQRAADFGVGVDGPVSVDMKRVKERKDAIVAKSRNGVRSWMEHLPNGTVYYGHARFESPRTVRVNGELLEANKIIVNTGGRAFIPNMPGVDRVPYLTNSSMMDVDFLPEHLLVVGGSYVGLEFAQAYRRFGARVTVVEMAERLIAREDPDVSDAVRDILEAEGIDVRLKAKCVAVEKEGNHIGLRLDCEEGAPRVIGTHLLLAVGRRPNTDDLGVDKAGIKTDGKGYIVVDDQCRTNVDGIWATGDVNGRGAFTHTSWNDFEIVAANLLDGDPRRITDRIPCYAMFIDPPLGRVGKTEREV
ncbi:MAG TPA: mercuric reductase, partial [Hyphomicrobiaceae bacterium]|nr:mercuric reductase [Hyphomicrobiaceae bacterium]